MAVSEKSKKDMFRERFSSRYPNVNIDDEDDYYTGANAMMDEFDGYEKKSKAMRENLSKSPMFAEMIVASRDQEDFDPIVWLVQNKGLDLKALNDDENYAERVAEAHNTYLEKMAKQDEIEEQMAVNMPKSIEAIRAKASEMNLGEEETKEVIGKLYQIMDDLIVGIVDPEQFEMVAKGMHFDKAVGEAKDEGLAQGLNTKVEDKLRKLSAEKPMPTGRQESVQPKVETKRRNPFKA